MSAALLALAIASAARSDETFEQPPIDYSHATPTDAVWQLQTRLEASHTSLDFDEKFGYLGSVLKSLKIPIESQVLVYSQTSLQRQRISPKTPRAVYFSDDVYVGYCQQGAVIEIAATDPQLGTVFYTLDQERVDKPQFRRQTESCLVCHSSSRTESVPGLLVRSLFVQRSGQPLLSEGSYSVDYRTPLEQRWGGWYVTGTHGSQTHLGNLVVDGNKLPRPIENKAGQNVTSLSDRLHTDSYPTPHSDIVALMVLEYQSLVKNRLTHANFTTREALHYQASMNRALGDPENTPLESVTHRIQSAGDSLVDALLFVDEPALTAPIRGTSGFAEQFAKQGPRDRKGRSLRDFDLEHRMFKYPCSYLIYSDAFRQLPAEVRDYVWQRLRTVLTETIPSEKFAHLTATDRQAIVEIICDTVPDLPAIWKDH